jgi:hypothetical protein
VTASGSTARYGKLGNLDRAFVSQGRTLAGVPVGCREIYMVSAPRFEQAETELEAGCFLTAGVAPADTTWSVDNSSKLTGDRYFIGLATAEERVRLVSWGRSTLTPRSSSPALQRLGTS